MSTSSEGPHGGSPRAGYARADGEAHAYASPELVSVTGPGRAQGFAVLGMHRSGTSMITGLLASAGAYAGRPGDLLEARDDNPHGFFEHRAMFEANEVMLADAGGSWWCPPHEDALARDAEANRRRALAMADDLRAEADGRPIVVKDPRLTVLWPIWQEALSSLHPVVVRRNPLASARSLRRRDAMPTATGLALWEQSMRRLLVGLTGAEVSVVSYDTVRAGGWATAAIDLRAALAPDCAARLEMTDSFVDDSLPGVDADAAEFEAVATGSQLALWDYLASLPLGRVEIAPPAAVVEAVDAGTDRLSEYDTDRRQLIDLVQEASRRDQELAELSDRLADTERRLAEHARVATELAAERVSATARADALAEEIAVMRATRSWRWGQRIARARRWRPGSGPGSPKETS